MTATYRDNTSTMSGAVVCRAEGWAAAVLLMFADSTIAAAVIGATATIIAATIAGIGAWRSSRRTYHKTVETQEFNRVDHGRVMEHMSELGDKIDKQSEQTGRRFDRLGHSVGELREDFIRHLDWHVNHPQQPPHSRKRKDDE